MADQRFLNSVNYTYIKCTNMLTSDSLSKIFIRIFSFFSNYIISLLNDFPIVSVSPIPPLDPPLLVLGSFSLPVHLNYKHKG